jgi:hypothetical protein
MALPTTGAISLSQVVAEFGGVAPHAMSEFYALLGKGVTGLPSSGIFNCSQFYGKSNQVVTSVWVSSGYNSTTNNYIGEYWETSTWGSHFYAGNSGTWTFKFTPNIPGYSSYTSVNAYSYTSGTRSYSRGSLRWTSSSGTNKSYGIIVYQSTTQWVDTSSYENTTTTAQITT